MKKRIITSTLLASAILLTGCNSDRGNASVESVDTDVQTTTQITTTENAANIQFEEAEVTEIDQNQPAGTIKILIYYDLVSQAPDLVDSFETMYDGSIEQEICSSGAAYFEKLGTLVASDLSPDIVRYEWMSFPHGISRNMYTPLDSYIDLDSELWVDMKDIAEQFAYNGKHYYYPYTLSSNFALNYNRVVLKEYGLQDPMDLYNDGNWTWDTFEELLKSWCDISPDHTGYTGVGGMSFVSTTGVKLIEVKGNEIINNVKNENVHRCMEFLERLNREELIGTGYIDPSDAFTDGKLLFLGMEPTWTYSDACESLFKQNVEYDMAFVPFPRDPSSDTYFIAYDSFGYMVPSGSKNIKGAVDWINMNRIIKTDPENIASEKAKATDSGTKYYPKCPECKYSYIENNTDELNICPECSTARRVRFNAYYSEEQYDLLQDMITPENGKFSMIFDNLNGFNSDFANLFQGNEESLLDGPLYNGASFTQLRESSYIAIETMLEDYRERLKNS